MSNSFLTPRLSGLHLSGQPASVASGFGIHSGIQLGGVRQQLSRKLDKYGLVKRLGYGTTGNVYLAKRLATNDGEYVQAGTCAIKVIRRSALGDDHHRISWNEVKILAKLRDAGFTGAIRLEESMGDMINRYIVLVRSSLFLWHRFVLILASGARQGRLFVGCDRAG